MGANNTTAGNSTAAPTPPDGGGFDAIGEVFAGTIGVGIALLVFAALIAVGWLIGRAIRAMYDRSRRGRLPTSRQILTGKLIVILSVLVVAAMSLTLVFDVDLVTLFTTLGIVSIALGFGLQNTVANLAAGFSLSFDRPFDVGDRIHVGETWGDVESVGLRSTRIVTVNGERVIIPNAVLDTQEVWNSTHAHRAHLRLDLPVGISYASSLPLAESLMLQVARRNDRILSFPDPVVRARAFGDSAIDLELRVWLRRAMQRPAAIDELVRGIKEAFDANGVHFPFPQRTISHLKDLDPPAPTPDHLRGDAASKPTVLVCTRSRESAGHAAPAVIDFVEKVEARLVVLNVRPRHEAVDDTEAQEAVNQYLTRAEARGLPAKGRMEVGDLSDAVVATAREEGARLVLFGTSRRAGFTHRWLRREVEETKAQCPVPVLTLDADQVRSQAFIDEWYEALHPPESQDAPEDRLPEEEPVEPETPGGEGADEKVEATASEAAEPAGASGAEEAGDGDEPREGDGR